MGKIFQKLRRAFLTGLVVLIPIVLTVYLVWSVISFIDKVVIPIIPPKYNPLDLFEIYRAISIKYILVAENSLYKLLEEKSMLEKMK